MPSILKSVAIWKKLLRKLFLMQKMLAYLKRTFYFPRLARLSTNGKILKSAATTSVSFLMNYQNPEKQNKSTKALKSLTAFVVLVLSCGVIFLSGKTSSQIVLLPDCATL